FVWQKNHQGMVRAARRVIAQRPNTYLLLIGDGPERAPTEALARELGLQDRVIFAGLRKDIARLLSAVDLFVFPSVTEGFGLVAVEAQAAGVPVAASRLPATREAIAPAFQSYLRDAHDHDGLGDAMVALLDRTLADPQTREIARAFGRQFSME